MFSIRRTVVPLSSAVRSINGPMTGIQVENLDSGSDEGQGEGSPESGLGIGQEPDHHGP